MKKIVNSPLGIKFGFILMLFLLLQVPVSMIEKLITERSHRQQDVLLDMARNSSGEQNIIGPFISIDYTKTKIVEGKAFPIKEQAFILPNELSVNASLDTFEKYRGIYKAHQYKAQTSLSGEFNLSALNELRKHTIDGIHLVVAIKDNRGLLKFNNLTVNNQPIHITPGTGIKQFAEGFQHTLNVNQLNTLKPLAFDFNFLLQGMGKLQITPIGNTTTVTLHSSWPHPSFIGDSLPISSEVSDLGFNATWESNTFSNNINQRFSRCIFENYRCSSLFDSQMGVDLIDPVDHYVKSHRSINYSLLIVTLIFACFFFLELFQARPIHPIQYGFVGLALALFYLLLISLSEHIGFNLAYTLSTLASTSLLCLYVGGMLRNQKQGLLFGAALLTLYALLFGLLQAESYALLMGTLLCFIILSGIMLMTKNINWYEKSAELNKEQQPSTLWYENEPQEKVKASHEE